MSPDDPKVATDDDPGFGNEPPGGDLDDLANMPDTGFDWRPEGIDDVTSFHDDVPVEVPDDEEAAPAPPPGPSKPPSEGETILTMVDDYLKSGNARQVIREHIAALFIAAGSKVGNWWNRNSKFTVHWYGPGIPYRYLSHATLLGASGHHKGATVDQFFQIVGEQPNDPAIWPCEEYKGGSIQGLRGGVIRDKRGEKEEVDGAIKRMDRGFIHIPEFTQIADLGQASGGAIQTILAWADSGRMSFETMYGGRVEYPSEATLLVGLQLARLDQVEETVLGWNRRSMYDRFPPMTVVESLHKNREPPIEGDSHLLFKLRAALRSMRDTWAPSSLDWTELKDWLDAQYLTHEATILDEQIAYSMALGHHMVTGGSWQGDVRIAMSSNLERILKRAIWNKGLSRIGQDRRGAHDAWEVLSDVHVLGNSQTLRGRVLDKIVAQRLSVGEHAARAFISVLIERGILHPSKVQPGPSGGRPATELRLARRSTDK